MQIAALRAKDIFGSGDGFSLRRRITALATVLLILAAVVLAVFVRDYAERAADRAFDRLLAASALSIAGAVQIEDGDVTLELPYAAFGMFSGNDRVFYAVRDPSGSLVTGYGDLAPQLPLAQSVDPVFQDIPYHGELLRIVSLGRLVSTSDATGYVTIQVAETQGARDTLSREIVNNAIAPILVLTMLAVLFVWYLIRRTFRPLIALEMDLRARRPDDLSPLAVPVPAEVSHLVAALNGFMERLKTSIDRLGELVAETAHQVRTPLASLRAQAEVALDDNDPDDMRARLHKIHEGAVRSSQLVTQLLMDATISHRLDRRSDEVTELGALVDEVIKRLDPDCLRRLEIVATDEVRAATLHGDRVAYREMLKNVVENALHYSDGDVTIDAKIDHGLIILVSDRGPGIPDVEKPLVTERFRRGSLTAEKSGSGLGLAIVKRVAETNGGTLQLSDREGGGLVAEIVLPAFTKTPPDAPRAAAASAPLIALLAAAFLATPTGGEVAAQPITYPAPIATEQHETLDIVGTTDTALFAFFIEGFQALNPGVTVRYRETDSLILYEDYLAGRLDPAPDLLISSASDLQLKLANDGHAMSYRAPGLTEIPAWARWRDEVFGFTFEPAVIVYNPQAIVPEDVPRTHTELAEILESEPERFRGRVATYDIAQSGVGYLLAAQDQFISSQFWRLASAFGRTSAVLSGSSPEIIDRIDSGDLVLGYNVLGSYAFARQAAGANIRVVVPDDFVLVLTRSIIIPRDAPDPDLSRAFVDFALSPAGQQIAAGPTALGALVEGTLGLWTARTVSEMGAGAVQPIALGPTLLVALDRQRRDRFLETWRSIVSPR